MYPQFGQQIHVSVWSSIFAKKIDGEISLKLYHTMKRMSFKTHCCKDFPQKNVFEVNY